MPSRTRLETVDSVQTMREKANLKHERWRKEMAAIHDRFVRPHLMGDSLEETRDRCSSWLQNFIGNL